MWGESNPIADHLISDKCSLRYPSILLTGEDTCMDSSIPWDQILS
jgi:hypothetical protein